MVHGAGRQLDQQRPGSRAATGFRTALRAIPLLVVALVLTAAPMPVPSGSPTAESTQAAFIRWQAANPGAARQVTAFEAFLRANDVDTVVPLASLLAGDSQLATRLGGRCVAPAFAVPPRALWPDIVPVLRAIRTHVIPVVGPVQVVSGWRDEAFNACVGGASRSHHTRFAAVDLVPVQAGSAAETMDRLCAMWRRSPASARIGLGAYLDPEKPHLNREGRFHIDVQGKRTWGFGFRSPTSWCNLRS